MQYKYNTLNGLRFAGLFNYCLRHKFESVCVLVYKRQQTLGDWINRRRLPHYPDEDLTWLTKVDGQITVDTRVSTVVMMRHICCTTTLQLPWMQQQTDPHLLERLITWCSEVMKHHILSSYSHLFLTFHLISRLSIPHVTFSLLTV